MPRYSYRCNSCLKDFMVIHSFKEKLKDCPKCNKKGTVSKLVSTSFSTNINKHIAPREVGKITEEFIDASRQELLQQREETIKRDDDS